MTTGLESPPARGRWMRHALAHDAARDWLGCLVAGTALLMAFMMFDDWLPVGLLAVPLVMGSQLLGPRQLPWFVVFVMACAAVMLAVRWPLERTHVNAVAVMAILALIILVTSARRTRLGVGGLTSEAMLVDLRDRILAQGTIPELPQEWQVEAELRSAGGTPFAGDFVVATRSSDQRRFDVVLVDVSGKGEQAGTRALLLSGALGGLLGAVPPADFLPAANAFLLRQNWTEGFASAIHLTLDLPSGAYEVRSAGHPPALLFTADGEQWTELEGDGPVLGCLPDLDFKARTGVLAEGEALLLYTDGMVESRRRDIDAGIDRLERGASRMLRGLMTRETVRRLVRELGSREDDRALVAVRRLAP